jgi:YD repeat-containing protein
VSRFGCGFAKSTVSESNARTHFLPDPDGVCMAVSPVTDFEYDAMSNLISVTDPLDNTTDYTFDNLYRLIEQTLPDPDGAGSLGRPETSYEYDLVGNLTKLTDPERKKGVVAFCRGALVEMGGVFGALLLL